MAEAEVINTNPDISTVAGNITTPGTKLKPKSEPSSGVAQGEDEDEDEDSEDDGVTVVTSSQLQGPYTGNKHYISGTNVWIRNAGGGGVAHPPPSGIKGPSPTINRDVPGLSKPIDPLTGKARAFSGAVNSWRGLTPSAESVDIGECHVLSVEELQRPFGKTAFDVNIRELDDTPWRRAGVDISAFFNYGFTEDTWREYSHKQLLIRHEQDKKAREALSQSTTQEKQKPNQQLSESEKIGSRTPKRKRGSHVQQDDSATNDGGAAAARPPVLAQPLNMRVGRGGWGPPVRPPPPPFYVPMRGMPPHPQWNMRPKMGMPPPPPGTINNTANGPGMPWGGGGPHPPHLPNMPFTGRPQELNERVGRLEHDNNDTTKEANDREEEKGLLSSKHDTDPSHSTTKTVEE